MALLDHDDLAAMIDAIGDTTTATINLADLAVVFLAPGTTVFEGEVIDHQGPAALAVPAQVQALAVEAGNEGDTLTVAGADYTVLAIKPGRSGIALLTLQEAA